MFDEFLKTVVVGNSIKAWLIAVLIAAGSIIVARIFYLVSTKGIKPIAMKLKSKLFLIIVDMLEEPLAVLTAIFGFFYAQRWLEFSAEVDSTIDKILVFIVILTGTWAVSRLVDKLISSYVLPAVQKSESEFDDHILPIVRKILRVFVWISGSIVAIDNAGYNVATIVAGLGIGGLAVAFAAQETIANLFGGITILVDVPFRMGDRVKLSGYEGWVREIGLRSTRIETLEGRRLVIPNSLIAKNVIENVSAEPATKIVEILVLPADLATEKIEEALRVVNSLLASDSDLEPKSTAFFNDFGEGRIHIHVVLWAKKDTDIGRLRTRINTAIVSNFSSAGIAFYTPSIAISR